MRAIKRIAIATGSLALATVLPILPTVADAAHRVPHPKRF